MRRRWRAAVVLALAGLLVCSPSTAFAAKTIALSSGTFEFQVDAGQIGQGEVIVSNDGDEPLKALVYVTDVEIDAEGEQTFVVPQRQGASLLSTPASWFRIYMPADSKSVGNTPYIELDVGESIPIKFEFTPPAGTAPGDHNTAIFFEMFEFADGSTGSAAQVSGRLGARVALRVTGQVVEKMTIRPFVVPTFKIGGKIPFEFTVNNDGNLNKRVEVTASLLDRNENSVLASVVATDTALYARSGRQFGGTFEAVGTRVGPHTVEVRVQYFEDGAQVASELVEQRAVWLVPLWAIVLAGFVVAYTGGYLVWRAVRGRRGQQVVESPTRHLPHRERDLEAEARRRRREERAAHPDEYRWDATEGPPPEDE